ncbi:DNA alkylation repair protein [bacterium]|nr:DNA alkylation repair protein [bacterium]
MENQSFELRAKQAKKLVRRELRAVSDSKKAVEMAQYMKSAMPFYGVQKPDRIPIFRQLSRDYAPTCQSEYIKIVETLWEGDHREERYLAIDYAQKFVRFADCASLPLFEHMIRTGAWWDFIDPIASALVGSVLQSERQSVAAVLNKWIEDEDLWIRRTAILSQLKHKKATDRTMLFEFCLKTMHEREFFIRKAIGWALREYSYSEPEAVKEFLLANKSELSPLSFREGAKHLLKSGLFK